MKFYKMGKEIITSRSYIMVQKNKTRISYLIPKNNDQKKNTFVHGTLLIKKQIDIRCYDEEFYAQDYKLFSDLLLMVIRLRQFPNLYIL